VIVVTWDARSNGLLYLDTTGKRYPVHDSIGWLPIYDSGKIKWVSDNYPADTDEVGHHAHFATVPPRYSEEVLENVKADFEVAGSWGDNAALLGIC